MRNIFLLLPTLSALLFSSPAAAQLQEVPIANPDIQHLFSGAWVEIANDRLTDGSVSGDQVDCDTTTPMWDGKILTGDYPKAYQDEMRAMLGAFPTVTAATGDIFFLQMNEGARAMAVPGYTEFFPRIRDLGTPLRARKLQGAQMIVFSDNREWGQQGWDSYYPFPDEEIPEPAFLFRKFSDITTNLPVEVLYYPLRRNDPQPMRDAKPYIRCTTPFG